MGQAEHYLSWMRTDGHEASKPAACMPYIGVLPMQPGQPNADRAATDEALHTEHQIDHEIQMAIAASMNYMLRGNKAMYVPADEIHGAMQNLIQQANKIKHQSKGNPSAVRARIWSAVGPNSAMAHSYHLHFEQHHPDHVESFEAGGQQHIDRSRGTGSVLGIPGTSMLTNTIHYFDTLASGLSHYHGEPFNH